MELNKELATDEVKYFQKGYKDKEGKFHRDFEIREIDGNVEEAIAKPDIKTNGGKMVRTILEKCITRIGTFTRKEVGEKVWREIIQSLDCGDQDIAFVEIRKETIGEEFEMTGIECPHCQAKLDFVVDTNEDFTLIPYNGEEEIDFELPKGYKDSQGVVHKLGKLRRPNGLDREILDPLARKNVGTANTMLLTRCITELGSAKITDRVIRDLSIKDRNYLVSKLKENNYGFETLTTLTCSECGEAFEQQLDLANFL